MVSPMRASTDLRSVTWPACLAVGILVTACSGSSDTPRESVIEPAVESQWLTYSGAWFTVQYPASFSVSPSLVGDDGDGFDSVFFDSPDSRASYYVLSPQWGRAADDLAFDPASEIQMSNRSHDEAGRQTVTRVIRAKDGSYMREMEEHFEQDATVYRVFQFRYANAAAHDLHIAGFRQFKASLEQYTD